MWKGCNFIWNRYSLWYTFFSGGAELVRRCRCRCKTPVAVVLCETCLCVVLLFYSITCITIGCYVIGTSVKFFFAFHIVSHSWRLENVTNASDAFHLTVFWQLRDETPCRGLCFLLLQSCCWREARFAIFSIRNQLICYKHSPIQRNSFNSFIYAELPTATAQFPEPQIRVITRQSETLYKRKGVYD